MSCRDDGTTARRPDTTGRIVSDISHQNVISESGDFHSCPLHGTLLPIGRKRIGALIISTRVTEALLSSLGHHSNAAKRSDVVATAVAAVTEVAAAAAAEVRGTNTTITAPAVPSVEAATTSVATNPKKPHCSMVDDVLFKAP